MATSTSKRLRECLYCAPMRERHLSQDFAWSDVDGNNQFYRLINNVTEFQNTSTLYKLTKNEDCESLRKNDYLMKVASAIVYFGERFIISDLNEYCKTHINEPKTERMQAYRVLPFSKWSDVRSYVGRRNDRRFKDWERDKMSHVYRQTCVIAEKNGISAQHWDTLSSLYEDRNNVCHPNVNIADATSMQRYAALRPPHENESVNALYREIVRLIPHARRDVW